MARQVLTLFIVIMGVLFLTRTCAQKKGFPKAVEEERVVLDGEALVTLEGAGGLAVRFDALGSIVSVRRGEETIIREVPRNRRPFGLLLKTKDDRYRALKSDGWESTAIPGGREFAYDVGGLRVTKRYLLTAGGLDLHLRIEGAGEDVRGFELGGPGGVVLEGAVGSEPVLFRRVGSGDLRERTYDEQTARQEEERATQKARKEDDVPISYRFHERERVAADEPVHRFGILGTTHYLALEDLGPADAINFEAYRANRGESGTTNEFETWISLLAIDRGYEGAFRLRWAARQEAAAREPGLAGSVEAEAEQIHWLENETLRVGFSDRGAAIVEAYLKAYSVEAGEAPSPATWVPIVQRGVPIGKRPLTLDVDRDRYGANAAGQPWEVVREERGLLFRLETPRGYRFEKRVRLPGDRALHLEVSMEVFKPSDDGAEKAKYRLVGPAGIYVADAYRSSLVARPAGLLLERRGGDDEERVLEKVFEEPLVHQRSQNPHLLRAVGIRGGFFVGALVSEDREDSQGRPVGNVVEAGVRGVQLAQPVKRPDGESSRDTLLGYFAAEIPYEEGIAAARYSLYLGPTATAELEKLGLKDAVNFGFFGTIGRGLMALMKLLESLVGSYGVAILLMTLFVRALLLPISYRTQLGMQRYSRRLQKIKPLLDELEKKLKGNRQKLNQERMRVMREHKVGFPLGCLMIFFQIPIWFALFGALRVEFALRHQPFLWCNDLTMPDRLFGLPFFPHWFNLFPILMLVLWVLQQKVAPQPGSDDPQVQTQMKMVKYMPYVFFFMLYNYAAALAVYMCVSSAWGIAEGRLVRKAVKRSLE